jgi:solute carrier family 8 (sodium/calcium exchanger)
MITSPEFFCMEAQGAVRIDVIRVGGLEGDVSVRFRTQEGTASPGKDYDAVEGVLEFRAGERAHFIDVTLIDDDVWEAEKTFKALYTCPHLLAHPHHHPLCPRCCSQKWSALRILDWRLRR